MVVIPDAPRVPRQAGNLGGFSAPGVVAPEDFTGKQIAQMGQAELGAGVAIRRTALAELQKINQSRAREVAALATGQDLEEGWFKFRALNGKAAVDAAPQFLEDYNKRTEEFAKSLDNDEQREAFILRRLAERDEFHLRIGNHRAAQIDVMDKSASDASLKSAQNRMIAFSDPEFPVEPGQDPQGNQQGPPRPPERSELLEVVIMEARQRAQKDGFGPETKESQLFVLSKTTEAHSGVINQMLVDGKLDQAGQYLQTYRDQIVPEQATKLQKSLVSALETRSNVDQKNIVDEIAARVHDSMEGQPLAAKRANIKEGWRNGLYDAKVMQAAIAMAESEETSFRNQREDQKKAIVNTVGQVWVQAFDAKAVDWKSTWESAYALLPADVRENIESQGFLEDAAKAWGEVKKAHLVDRSATDPDFVVTTENFKSMGEILKVIDAYKTREANILGDKAKTPEMVKEIETIRLRIKDAEARMDLLLDRTHENALHIQPRAVVGATAPSPQSNQLSEEQRRAAQAQRLIGLIKSLSKGE